VELTIFSIDQDRGTLLVCKGKGKKDRMIPIGDRAMAWVDKYVQEVRPKLAMEPDEGVLFLTGEGEAVTPGHLTDQVSAYIEAAGIGKKGSCHLFRHSMATAMLESGADIRFIQAMLGHESLTSTELYTRVSIRKLKEIHTATHPAARLERKAVQADAEDDPAADEAEVLARLEEEADEDGEG
jgi:integrase/recombinase XerD